ncbi:glycogen-binding domain-containing protein [Haliangium sp.]|uniref:glycogen-binding domain-containing protein n=1 Tax=Haliangium sp. TaxID=2663208 RepID=UPI003D140030
MKSHSILLSAAFSTLMAIGCGAPAAEVEEPAQLEAAEASASDDGMAGEGEAAAAMSAGEGEGEAAAADATALGPQISATGEVRFNFKPTGRVKKIFLAGNFNGWNPSNDAYLLSDEDGDGIYSISIELEPGVYQYKFVIDGRWTKDPNSPAAHPDGFGGQNGKFEVK